jgi:hypothetical protein
MRPPRVQGRTELPPEIAFLAHHGIPLNILKLAAQLAHCRGTRPRQELFVMGFDRAAYWRMLADDLGLGFAADLSRATLQIHAETLTTDAVRLAGSVLVLQDGCLFLVVAPEGDEISRLHDRLRRNPRLADRLFVAAPETIREFLVARRHTALTHYAVNRLSRVLPRLSVRRLGIGRGASGPTLLAGAAIALSFLAPSASLLGFGFVLTAFFANCAAWKLAAAFCRPPLLRLQPVPTELLPAYTVLVPLYREADVVGDLARRLASLDYPASKLQVLILLEADDIESSIAAAVHARESIFELVVVPPGGPRTKPKALSYALPFARGDLVVVYDAEDRPEPDQLRKAAAAFRERPGLGCVQARLAPDNEESLLARLFKIEYAANFEILLPALASWGAPLPLGGTSNHFPREVLEKVGAWDPFNVTEDADLGVRLARFGFQSATILSRTYEEAPVTFRQWLPQRRRWIKGWMRPVNHFRFPCLVKWLRARPLELLVPVATPS